MALQKKLASIYLLAGFYLMVSFILRVILLFCPITQSTFSGSEIFRIIALGLFSDFLVFVITSFFLGLYLIFISNSKYRKPWGYLLFTLFVGLLIYISFCNTLLNEYGGVLPELAILFIGFKTIMFGLLLFLPKYRKKIRIGLFSLVIFIYVQLILINAISEYFFWNEFGVKYNFIAVDYLVYTNEVIGNIMKSYPVIPILIVLVVISGFITFFIVKQSRGYIEQIPSFIEKVKISFVYSLFFGFSLVMIPVLSTMENTSNVYINELESNGLYKFYSAFMNSELDYFKFYQTIPNKRAFAFLNQELETSNPFSSFREIHDSKSELHKNVVLIMIESYSADFMKMYGNEQHITPFLDSLATKSLLFTNLYAAGNRTVRGLEAVTLCLPPTAGESVVKRKDNQNKCSTGRIFKEKGYQVKYLYGGDAYFDNMEQFYEGNGYDVLDIKNFKSKEITFSNVWGVCDEDIYSKAITVMNAESKQKKPFFNHIMTVSNHRPFTYPAGKIDISGEAQSREGGVKYTDFALKKFFKLAKKQPWFKNTVFVIVADHCASSSGKTALPLDKYRIPGFIYSPEFIVPQHFNVLMSQIDVMPTLMGLLHFSYPSKFYGQDVLKESYKPRAFIATYQNLGFIRDQVLTVISPKKQIKQYELTAIPNPKLTLEFQLMYEQKPLKLQRPDLIEATLSYYQTTSYLLKNKKLQH